MGYGVNYDRANNQEKAEILKYLASNYTIVDVTITPIG